MKIFISWSGELSRTIAEELRDWLPAVIQAVKPYFTPDDIAKGSRWNSDISKELSESSVGLICLTPDNLSAPWVMFEAGALAKNLEKSKVCPLLFNVEPADIEGPLVQFQAAEFRRDDFFRVIRTVNAELKEQALAPDILETVFDMWWPKLKEKIDALIAHPTTDAASIRRSERDILEEVLAISRSLSRSRSSDHLHPQVIRDILDQVSEITAVAIANGQVGVFKDKIMGLEKPLVYLARRAGPAAAESTINRLETLRADLEKADDDIPF